MKLFYRTLRVLSFGLTVSGLVCLVSILFTSVSEVESEVQTEQREEHLSLFSPAWYD